MSNSQSKTQETNLIYYQIIKKNWREKKKDYQTVTISEYNIDSSSGFDTEEFVRDIFVSEENLPDVLVCMDEVVTECVYQALVDYNQVGNVDVVGFLLFRCNSGWYQQRDYFFSYRSGYG